MAKKKIDLIYIDAGGGHRAAVTALDAVIHEQQRPWETRARNIQDLLHSIDVIRKVTGIPFQEVYNIMLRRGWTLGTAQLIPPMHLAIRLFHDAEVRALATHWSADPPDMVLSLIPHYNRAIKQALTQVCPQAALVTILTDIADYPPHFWLEKQEQRQPQHVICGSDKAVSQATEMGYAAATVHRVSGMILNPRFYEIAPLAPEARKEARAALSLDPERPVGLVLFGGQGAAVMLDIAASLPDHQLLLICGHNQKLRAKLEAMPHRAPMFVEGFTLDVPRYMQLADYFIGKPGPASISEAVAMRLPVIVESNSWTLPQERYNAVWIREQGVGAVLPNFRRIARAVEEMLEPAAFARFRAATERLHNRAVFEIPDILEAILNTAMPDAGGST